MTAIAEAGRAGTPDRTAVAWLLAGWVGVLVLPWYDLADGFWSFRWLAVYPGAAGSGPAWAEALLHGRVWLLALGLPLAAPLVLGTRPGVLIRAGLAGLILMLAQGYAIGIQGWSLSGLESLFGAVPPQPGFGYGAALTGGAFLFLVTTGMARRGALNGDGFLTGAVGLIVLVTALFVLAPVIAVLGRGLLARDGSFMPGLFVDRLTAPGIWGAGCLVGSGGCGVAWNSLIMGLLTATSSTVLGLAFALIATRTGFRAKRLLRALTILPIITPPFVIGLVVILLFGRSGMVTDAVASLLDVPRSRWIYGLPGIWFAQTLAFTPIAFLVLIGVVEGVSPSMEEAAQTLRASRWRTFTTVSLPLMRPGIANAFLLSFIESLSDFGNPLVLGGNYHVLAIDIFTAIAGAQYDPGKAAVLAVILLGFTLLAFLLQQRWLGRASYVTVTGKGDSGLPLPLPRAARIACYGLALPWAALTLVVYAMILFGGFVRTFGRDYTLTLAHYVEAFRVDVGVGGLVWSGTAWNSFWATLKISAISAPLTAAIGLMTAYLLTRQRFRGQRAFEFATMLSFAVPGTVIGISYVLAFNTPPIEMTGTALILVISFVFRNMPVGVRGGIAALGQIDRSLDEASMTLGARSPTTLRRVVLPLLRPAVIAALVYSFVRAMTAISAVIFLVSANYHMATAYIIGRAENGDYGLAIAYSSVLILIMMAAILLVNLAVGRRQLGRRAGFARPPVVVAEA